jgi:DNA polymerase-3 subunit epsilon
MNLPSDGVRLEHSGSLAQRALDLLAAGPLSTPELAARVMGVSGGGSTAARAIWALLGSDARFAVNAEGFWSLAVPDPALVRMLRHEEWAVVDFETTGGSPAGGHRVTEVAVVRVSGGVVRDSYSTLVNPERRIPGMITSLTGITQEMVAFAPRFCDVAHHVGEAVEGAVFVAHNAAFDWRFLCHEMQHATGASPAGRQLCTVRVARKLLPNLSSRGLDALSVYFGVEIESRHRALDDARATAHILLRLIDMLEDRGVADWEALQILLGARAKRASRKRSASPRSMEAA